MPLAGSTANVARRPFHHRCKASFWSKSARVLLDAEFWPIQTSKRVGGFRLLRSATPELLVTWDRGFHDYAMLWAVREREQPVGVISMY